MKFLGGHVFRNGEWWSATTDHDESFDKFATLSAARWWLEMAEYVNRRTINSPKDIGEETDGFQEGFNGVQETEGTGYPRLGMATIEDGVSDTEESGSPQLW